MSTIPSALPSPARRVPRVTPRDLRGLLLDFDGTLVDSYPLIEWAFGQVCVAHQLAPEARDRFAAARGLPLPEQMRCVSPTLWEELTDTYRRLDAERGRHARVFPGILPMLRQAQRQGLSLGVVSSKRRQLVLNELQATGLKPFFPVVVALEDSPTAKPHAAPLRIALQRMGIKPAQALYVGDTLVDMEAGRRARVQTMLAAWGLSPALRAQMNGHFARLLHPRELLPIITKKPAA